MILTGTENMLSQIIVASEFGPWFPCTTTTTGTDIVWMRQWKRSLLTNIHCDCSHTVIRFVVKNICTSAKTLQQTIPQSLSS